MRRVHKFLVVLACLVLTSNCSEQAAELAESAKKYDIADPELGLNRDDYNKDMYKPKSAEAAKAAEDNEPPIPDLAEILAAPKPPKLGEAKLVSIAVTDDVPLKDVLIELARLADIDIEVDSSITGGITFRAKDRPFNEVIERIANLAALRYTMKNNVLRVERDTPYIQEYSINFLNVDRTASGSINVGGSANGGSSSGGSSGSSGGSSGSSGSGATSGSSASVASKSDSDFWAKFDDGVKQILSYSESKRISSTDIATQPALPAAPTSPPALPGQPSSKTPAAGGTAGVEALAASEALQGIGQASAGGAPKAALPDGGFYIINKQASTLTVSATERQHEMIKRFLTTIEANMSSQVLIEAKLLEVTLSDEYQTGINWTKFGNSHVNFNGNLDTVSPNLNTKITSPSITLLNNDVLGTGITLSTAVNLLNEFGTTRALSSPRLHAMNNQQAVLSFAEGLVSFNVQITTTQAVLGANNNTVTPAQVNVTSTQRTTPIGIILTLQPSINTLDNEVTLSIRPTLTKKVDSVPDPGFEISKASAIAQLPVGSPEIAALQSVTSLIPEIETRELDSIVKIKSGQALVIGGLIQDNTANTEAGIPGLSEVPWLGNLFKSVDKSTTKQELVIFIRATIVDSNGGAEKADKILYHKFGNDPRPLNF